MTSAYTYHSILRLLRRYMIALGLVGAGCLLCFSIPQVMAPRPFLAFWPVVVVAAELGGIGPGLLATVASILCVHVIINPLLMGLSLNNWVGMTTMGIFLAGGLAISVFIGRKWKIQSLQRLQATAMQSATNGIALTDVHGILLWANSAFCAMKVYAPEEIVGKPHWLLEGDEQNEAFYRNLWGTVWQREAWHGELVGRRKDGTIYVEERSVTPVTDADGRNIHCIIITQDITERRQAESALSESNSLLRVAGCVARFGGWKVNLMDGKVTWSDEVACIHDEPPGYSPAETDDGINYYAPEWQEKITKVFGDCVRDGTPFDEEMQIITAYGRRVWVRTTGEAVRKAAGEIIQVHGAFQDITQRKQAEEVLRKTEYLMSEGQKIAHLGTFEYDAATRQTIWSEEEYRIYGLDPCCPSPEYNNMLAMCIHPDDRDTLHQVFTSAIQSSSVYELEHRIVRPDGSIRWVYDRAHPYFDATGTLIRYIGTTLDVTERKEAEKKIRKLNVELEERVRERTAQLEAVNKELETFTYSVSHDLKAPLRGIDGYSQLLEMEYSDRLDAEGQLFIRNVRNSAAQMSELIDDLLSYSRMERRILQHSSFDLSLLVQVVLAEQMADIEQGNVNVNLAIPALTVRTDRDGLAIVLRNLLENAVKFSRNALPPIVEVGARTENGRTIIWVRDNGIGFDMKFHDRIFEIFQRLQRVEEYPGTGIGLALVQKSIQRMGGRVWAESAPGKGATFFLEIPHDNSIV